MPDVATPDLSASRPSSQHQAYYEKPLKISASKITTVQAMLDAGLSYKKVQQVTGLSPVTVAKVKKQRIASNVVAEKIKKNLRNRWAVLADRSLDGLTDDKLAEASAKDLAYIAHKATEMAGLAPPSVTETYITSMQSFLVQETPQPVVIDTAATSDNAGHGVDTSQVVDSATLSKSEQLT